MSKFSYLLILLAFLFSCSSSEKSEVVTTSLVPSVEIAKDKIEVDKSSNSIKVVAKTVNSKKQRPLFDWPVWEARMTRGYLPQGKGRRKRPHRGIDLAAPRGSAVMASNDGIVIYTGSGFSGYGKMIMIETVDAQDGGNWATLYGHLDKILVYEGKKVRQGEVIGALGNTGRSSGPHLHFEIRRLNGPIDPLPMLPAGEALTNDVDDESPDE